MTTIRDGEDTPLKRVTYHGTPRRSGHRPTLFRVTVNGVTVEVWTDTGSAEDALMAAMDKLGIPPEISSRWTKDGKRNVKVYPRWSATIIRTI